MKTCCGLCEDEQEPICRTDQRRSAFYTGEKGWCQLEMEDEVRRETTEKRVNDPRQGLAVVLGWRRGSDWQRCADRWQKKRRFQTRHDATRKLQSWGRSRRIRGPADTFASHQGVLHGAAATSEGETRSSSMFINVEVAEENP